MEPIFYKDLETDDYYRLILKDDTPQSEIDVCLDVLNDKMIAFISEDEFMSRDMEYMDVSVLNQNTDKEIGRLLMRNIEVEGVDYELSIVYKPNE